VGFEVLHEHIYRNWGLKEAVAASKCSHLSKRSSSNLLVLTWLYKAVHGRLLDKKENSPCLQALKPYANNHLPRKLSSAHRAFFKA
jgi:hypothetical protein